MTGSVDAWPLLICTSPATLKDGIKPARSGYSVGLYSIVPQAWSSRTPARTSSFVRIFPSPLDAKFDSLLRFELLELEVRALHEVPPLLDVGVEESYEVCLVVLEEADAAFRQFRACLGLLEHGLDVARDPRSELGRNGNGREESLPERRLVLRQSLLGDGRHVRCGGVALLARDAERPRPPRIRERQADRHARKVINDAPRHDVLHGRRAAPLGGVDRADAGHHVEQLPPQGV